MKELETDLLDGLLAMGVAVELKPARKWLSDGDPSVEVVATLRVMCREVTGLIGPDWQTALRFALNQMRQELFSSEIVRVELLCELHGHRWREDPKNPHIQDKMCSECGAHKSLEEKDE